MGYYVRVFFNLDMLNQLNCFLDKIEYKGLLVYFVYLNQAFKEIDISIVSSLKFMDNSYGIVETVEDKYNESFINSDLYLCME